MSGLGEAPVVAHVVRNGFVESVHRGLAVVTGPPAAPGRPAPVVRAVGGPDTPIFPRSSLKPVQAWAMLRAGAPLAGRALALACASHRGEPFHRAGVEQVLADAGLTPADLRTTPDLPLDEDAAADWLRAGRGPEPIAHCCSGKHAGMLATCVAAGWPTEGYLDPDHPLQRHIIQTLADLGTPPLATGTDGCGAPVHAIPLVGLARHIGRIAAASTGPERQVADAMRGHPEYVSGSRGETTVLMRAVPGLVAKDGVEGVHVAGLPDGRGFAVKIVDGADRAARVVLAALLRDAGVDPDALTAFADVPVLGHGVRVGRVASTVVG